MASDFSPGQLIARKRRLWLALGACVVLIALVAVVVGGNMARDANQQSLSKAKARWGQVKVDHEDALKGYERQLKFAVAANGRGVSSLRETDLVIKVAGSFAGEEETQTFRDFQASVSDALGSDTGVFVDQYIETGKSEVSAVKMSANSPDEMDAIEAEIDRFDEATHNLRERTQHLSAFAEQIDGDGTDRFFSKAVPAFNQSVYDTAITRLAELDHADPERIREAQAWIDADMRTARLDSGIIFPVTRTVTEAAVSHLENLEVTGQSGDGVEWLPSDLPTIQLSLPRVKSEQKSCVEIQKEGLKAGGTFVADASANSYWLDWVLSTTSNGEKKTEWRVQTYVCD